MLILVLIPNIGKRTSNVFFVIFFTSQFITFSNIILYSSEELADSYLHLHNIAPPFWFVWAPAFFLAILFDLNKIKMFSWKQLLHFLPAILFTLYLVFSFHIKPELKKQELLTSGKLIYIRYYWIVNKAIIIQVFIYNILTILIVEKYIKSSARQFTKQQKHRLKWIRFIVYGYFTACIVYDLVILSDSLISSSQSFRTIVVGIFAIYFTTILYKALSSSQFSYGEEKKRYHSLNQKQAQQLQKELDALMQNDKPYLDFDANVSGIAQKLSTNNKHISELLNLYYQKNFYEYINEYRIEEAKQLLVNSKESKKTILEIAYASGFNSKSAFNSAFKKNTGMSPTQYRNSVIP